MQDCGLQESPDITRAQMIRHIRELAQLVQLFCRDSRMVINACPSVETLPVPLKDGVLYGLIELGAGIWCRHRKLNGESVESLRIADGLANPLDRVIWES